MATFNTNNTSFKTIAVKKYGNYKNRPTIIFLHDSLGCIKLWRDFPEKLSSLTKCNILIYDRFGYGASAPFLHSTRDTNYLELEADLLNQLINFWDLDTVILFGHSDGGSIALIAAAKYPKKIKGIITEGAHVFVEEITISGIKEAIELYKTTNLPQKLEKYHGNKTEAMFWAWASTWTTKEFQKWNIEHFIPKIQCPSLIIQGTEDEYGTLRQVESIINYNKTNASSFIIPNIKHTPHKEVPELILEKSTSFIKNHIFK